MQFLQQSGLSACTVNERQQAYHILAELVVQHARYVARKSGAPLSPKLVANCMPNLPGVFEDAFPGYLEAGVAAMVAKSSPRYD